MLDVEQITRHRGHKLIDADGTKIGDIQEIYLDDDTGRPEWVLVNTGLFGTKSHFVPIDQAQPDGDDLRVSFTKDMVKDCLLYTSDAADDLLCVDLGGRRIIKKKKKKKRKNIKTN